jgi:hypothetical protein
MTIDLAPAAGRHRAPEPSSLHDLQPTSASPGCGTRPPATGGGRLYLAANGRAELDRAQAELDKHLIVSLAGRCRSCGGAEPCAARLAAMAVFARYRRLPRRMPGLASAGFR